MLDNILTGDGSHATAVDPLYDTFDKFNNNIKISGKEEKVTVHKNISHKVLKNLRETSMILFILMALINQKTFCMT